MSGHHNRIWVTAAQAFLGADLVSKLQDEAFKKDVDVILGALRDARVGQRSQASGEPAQEPGPYAEELERRRGGLLPWAPGAV